MRQHRKQQAPQNAEETVRDIRRATRRQFSAEEKIRIVLEGLRGEDSIAELCRKEDIAQNLYYRWSKEFLEAGKKRRIRCWEHEAILERVYKRLNERPETIPLRSKTVEHPFRTIKAWMGAPHFKMKTMKHVATEMALNLLAYNLKRVMAIIGVPKLLRSI